MSRHFGVIPAAGGGTRFGAGTPKQYAQLDGAPMLGRVLDRLQAAIAFDTIVVALAPDDRRYEQVIPPRAGVEPVRCGGASRRETVRNALRTLATRCDAHDWVLVHDAARPCVSPRALQRLLHELRDDPVGGLLAIPLADTLKRADSAATVGVPPPRVLATADRQALWQAQTPQMFRYAVLRDALESGSSASATDESQAVEALGHRPRLVQGSADNLKVTFPGDILLAEAILSVQRSRDAAA